MKKTMPLLLLCATLFNSTLFGQDSTKARIKEYYLTIADFSPVNIQLKYKRQIGKKTFFKIGLVNLSASQNEFVSTNSNNFENRNTQLSAGLQIGLEFRKQLSEKFTLFHGPNIGVSYFHQTNRTLNPAIPTGNQKDIIEGYNGSIPYTLGLLFKLSPHILVGAEINPSINYTVSNYKNGQNTNVNHSITSYNASFDNRWALISLVYRL